MRWEPLHPPQPPPLPSLVAFTGDRGDFFRLVAKGAVLELITREAALERALLIVVSSPL
jgi:hypothetical protein